MRAVSIALSGGLRPDSVHKGLTLLLSCCYGEPSDHSRISLMKGQVVRAMGECSVHKRDWGTCKYACTCTSWHLCQFWGYAGKLWSIQHATEPRFHDFVLTIWQLIRSICTWIPVYSQYLSSVCIFPTHKTYGLYILYTYMYLYIYCVLAQATPTLLLCLYIVQDICMYLGLLLMTDNQPDCGCVVLCLTLLCSCNLASYM